MKNNLPPPSPITEWLTVRGACQYAQCSRQTLWRWRREEGLPSGRGGRVRRRDLDAWLAGVEDSPTLQPSTDLLKLDQAAARAGVSRQTLWRWNNDGLKVVRRGRLVRIRADELDAYLEGLN